MEFSFQINKVLDLNEDGIAVLHSSKLNPRGTYNSTPFYMQQFTPNTRLDPTQEKLSEILDKMGEASSKAQGLKSVITNYVKFVTSEENRLYIRADSKRVYGILKVGKRNLFYHDNRGNMKELKPLCVLDFYVHESCQRSGIGKILFEYMLEKENIEPRLIANENSYDRPSPKLFAFLKKHYGLQSYIPQNNNFVIFNAYWDANLARNTRSQKTEQQDDYSKPFRNATNQSQNSQTNYSHQRTNSRYNYLRANEDSETSDYYARRTNQNQSQKNLTLNLSKNTSEGSENMLKPSSPVKRGNNLLKMTKEEQELLDLQNKLRITDEQLNKTKAKVTELDQKTAIQQRKNREFFGGAPWACTEDNFDRYTSSNNYGRHYAYSHHK